MAAIETVKGMGVRSRGLGSARDRERLRERVLAERARVEQVLARGPREVPRRRASREAPRPLEGPVGSANASMQNAVRFPAGAGAKRGCGLCGGSDIFEDKVEDEVGGGREDVLLLGRCRRCDHRWTHRMAARFVPRVRRPEPRSGEIRPAPVRRGAAAVG